MSKRSQRNPTLKLEALRKGVGTRILTAVLVANLVGAGCSPGPKLHYDAEGVGAIRASEAKTRVAPAPQGLAFLRPGEKRRPYRIGPFDRISVIVVGRPDLGSQTLLHGWGVTGQGILPVSTVAEDSTCYLPGLGRVKVGGLTVDLLGSAIRDLYGDVSSRIDDPEVVVDVVVTRSSGVFMDGQVAFPGMAYFSDARLTLGEMVSAAGGLTQDADPRHTELIRKGKVYPIDYRDAQQGRNVYASLILEDGDRVYFPSIQDQKVYVFGEVVEPGEFPIPAGGLTMLDALAKAKGPDPVRAKTKSLYLLRPAKADTTAFKVTFGELLETNDVMLRSGDRVYVPTTGLTTFARTFTMLLPFLTFATTVILVIYGLDTNND